VRTHDEFRKIRSFLGQKCGCPNLKNPPCPQNVRTGQTPLDCGRLLWTASNHTFLTCLHDQNKSGFLEGRPFPANQGFFNTYQIVLIG